MPNSKNIPCQRPASLIQHQFWLINQMHPGNSAYNIASLFDIEGPLDTTALGQSLRAVIARHDILRTGFTHNIGQLVQNIYPETSFSLQVIDPNRAESDHRQDRIAQLIADESRRPFDLQQGPLIRALLIQKGPASYSLLIVMHHIITDLRSKEIFSRELAAHYNPPGSGGALQPPHEIHQYGDYALWQKQWLDSPAGQKMAEFWTQELKQHSGILNLPADLPRPSAPGLKGDWIPFQLDPDLTAALKDLSAVRQVDIFIILLAAYITLLFKYSNQSDIIVGVPLTNRRQTDHKDTLGCFVNILPLAFAVSADLPFAELLKQVRLKMLLAHRNQEMPFTKILEAVQPRRVPGTNALFQTGFTVEPPMLLDLHKLRISPRKIHNQGAQLDLFLSFLDISATVQGYFEYNTEIFYKQTIGNLCGHYQNLLKSAAAAPETTLGAMDILSPAEKKRLVTDWNDTAAELPPRPCLHYLFEQQAEKTPHATAAVHAGSRLTYAELNAKANRLAHYLTNIGIGPGTCAAVYLPRSLDMLIAIQAVLKAGGAYIPLDPAFPSRRLEFILEDTRAPVLITRTDMLGRLSTPAIKTVCLDRDSTQIQSYPEHNPCQAVAPDDLAYILHTSGSTGKPKGVQVPHIAVVNFLLSMKREPGITAEDTLLAVTTLSFDISVLELFLPLCVGASIVLADQQTAADGQALLALIRSSGATIMQATPATWHLLFAAGLNQPLPLKVLCGGENLPPGLARQLCGISDSVWNLYGPTETTIWSTCAQIKPNGPVSAGRPIANTQLYIVDQNLQLTPPGVAGELLIGGFGVSRGYLNRPELTREKFIPDPFGGQPDRRLYRTGDMARYFPDGSLQILGRIDHQVKLRGFRIELGEIEAALSRHPSIKQTAVILHEISPRDKRLVAYYTSKADQADTAELREFLRDSLPDYMLPAIFNPIEIMPLTDNGKINRKALPTPALQTTDLNKAHVPPETPTQKTLCSVWQQLLGLETISITDNFFEIGGNSLSAVESSMLIENQLKKKVLVAEIFQYPTIATLAAHMDQGDSNLSESVINRAQRQRQALSRRKKK